MRNADEPQPGWRPRSHSFCTTQWAEIFQAADPGHPHFDRAWDRLAELYWYPLYAFARRSGCEVESARDLTQGFFVHLLSGDLVAGATPRRGKFRTLLLTSFKNFLSMQGRRQMAQKRGGGQITVSLDDDGAESLYQLEPADLETPDVLFERRWALQRLERALDRLETEVAARANPHLFVRLKKFLVGEEDVGTCAEIGAEFGMSEGAVKAAVHRLRQRYRTLVREEIAATVLSPSEVDEELRHVLKVLIG